MSTSTIQIKRGTGSAVPSGLTDGELAINLDSGRLYYGSGSNSVDSYTFTNVTASGDISASGTLDVTGNVNFDGDLDVDGTTNLDVVDIDGDITIADAKTIIGENRLVMSAPRLTFKIDDPDGTDNDALNIMSGSTTIAKFAGGADLATGADHTRIVLGSADILGQTSTVKVDGTLETTSHISASGDITASGGLTLGDGQIVGFSGLGRGTVGTNRTIIRGGATQDGDIKILSGSSTVASFDCSQLGGGINFGVSTIPSPVVTITGDLRTTSHITASGNIITSGFISASSDIIAGGKISASGDLIGNQLDINGIVGAVRVISGDTGNLFAVSGINTLNLGKLLHLTTTNLVGSLNMSQPDAGHITASGNISSSGNILVDGSVTAASTGSFARLEATSNVALQVSNSQQIVFENSTNTNEFANIFMNSSNDMLFQNLRSNSNVLLKAGNSGNEGNVTILAGGSTNEIAKFGKTADLNLTGNLTASGNILANGELSGSTLKVKHRELDINSDALGSNGGSVGDIVKFGSTTTVAGILYALKPDGTWTPTNASSSLLSTGSIAVAIGANSSTDGMLLRGITNLAADPGAGIGSPVFLSTTTSRVQAAAPSASGDFVRIMGHQFGVDKIYFNPSPDFIKVS